MTPARRDFTAPASGHPHQTSTWLNTLALLHTRQRQSVLPDRLLLLFLPVDESRLSLQMACRKIPYATRGANAMQERAVNAEPMSLSVV